jgi:hypothetical protein
VHNGVRLFHDEGVMSGPDQQNGTESKVYDVGTSRDSKLKFNACGAVYAFNVGYDWYALRWGEGTPLPDPPRQDGEPEYAARRTSSTTTAVGTKFERALARARCGAQAWPSTIGQGQGHVRSC